MSVCCITHPRTSPTPEIAVDPCVQLDCHGLWATARLLGPQPAELDLHVPLGPALRRVEVGHGADALAPFGSRAKSHILAALDKALARPLRLVVDPRQPEGKAPMVLDGKDEPREGAVTALATILEAQAVRTASYAIEFSIPAPRKERLGFAAASVFGPVAMRLFGALPKEGVQGGVMLPMRFTSMPLPDGAHARLARYIRTAHTRPEGRNTVDAQRDRISAYAERRGYTVERELIDEACNGLDIDRPGLRELTRMAESAEIDGVVVASLCRLSRSDAACERILDRLQRAGVAVLVAEDSVSAAQVVQEASPPAMNE